MRKTLLPLLVLFSVLVATAATPTHTVTLNWNAVTGATTYNIYRGTATGAETLYASGVAVATYTDPTVTNGTTYFYEVTAVGTGGESAPSAEVSAQIPVPPSAPTGLTIKVN
jgi:fibronectin type 3 domain-containing protein